MMDEEVERYKNKKNDGDNGCDNSNDKTKSYLAQVA